jgi:hypothetical protein
MSCTPRISFIPRFARSLYRQVVGAFAIVAQHQRRFLLSTLIDLPSLPPCCHRGYSLLFGAHQGLGRL